SNGLEAFEKRKNSNFDIIFMDIQMPVLDGMEATMEILDFEEDEHLSHVPIIALTANALKGDRERFMAVGMDEYTTKPLVRSDILNLLSHFVGDKMVDTKSKEPLDKTQSVEISAADQSNETADATAPAASPSDNDNIAYDKDILLAKKSVLENKLFSQILNDLGYSYEMVTGGDNVINSLQDKAYKIILFDQEMKNIDIPKIHDVIESKTLKTATVMMVDPGAEADDATKELVDDTIKNVINKDLLRLVFEKYL
ncbi:MAG TPA: response regulator, partial [Sulfuricurvum sp.]|nr:response regulator [Sulfuricurvum sp.]